MVRGRQTKLKRHLTEEKLDEEIEKARKKDKTDLLQRLCFIKNMYKGDKPTQAANRVGVSQATSSR